MGVGVVVWVAQEGPIVAGGGQDGDIIAERDQASVGFNLKSLKIASIYHQTWLASIKSDFPTIVSVTMEAQSLTSELAVYFCCLLLQFRSDVCADLNQIKA